MKDSKARKQEVEHETYTPSTHESRTVVDWYAPGRPFQKHSKEYYINSLLIILAIEVILFLFSQYLLMLVVVSIAFLAFALSITPPPHLYYRISTEGVTVEDHFYLWQELYDFYLTDHGGAEMIHIRTKAYYPGELLLMVGDAPKDHIRDVLIEFLPYREVVRKTFTEKAGNWLVKSFPLEKTSHHASGKVPSASSGRA